MPRTLLEADRTGLEGFRDRGPVVDVEGELSGFGGEPVFDPAHHGGAGCEPLAPDLRPRFRREHLSSCPSSVADSRL